MQSKDKVFLERALTAEEVLMKFTASAMQEESLTKKIRSLTELQEIARAEKQKYYDMYVSASTNDSRSAKDIGDKN